MAGTKGIEKYRAQHIEQKMQHVVRPAVKDPVQIPDEERLALGSKAVAAEEEGLDTPLMVSYKLFNLLNFCEFASR